MKPFIFLSRTFCSICGILILFACMNSSINAQILTSTESDKETGAEVAKQVEQQIGIYHTAETTDYIRAIGKRLVANLEDREFDFQFHIADQWEPNAFALPGGYIYFSRGLLILANEEGELAGVMGHEISHVTERHSARQQQRAIIPGLLTVPGNIVSSVVSEDLGNLINTPINMIGHVSLASYSRKQESQADKLGMRLSAKTGYDPLLLAQSLQQLEKDVEMLTQRKREFSFFDSHPMTPERVSDIQREGKKIQWSSKPGITKDRKDFLERLDGLYFTENPAQGVFHGQKFLHPELNFTITFPEKWKTVNTPSLVGALMENKEAMIFINAIGKATDPEKQGQALIEELQKKHKKTPETVRSDKIGNWPAYLISFSDASAGSPAHIHYLWVTIDKLTYQLIGAGADHYKDKLRETVYSLRPLTKKERDSITGIRLRIATAKGGESLAEMGKRTGNVWSPDYTAMMNDIPENVTLAEGQLLKIAREEKYTPVKK